VLVDGEPVGEIASGLVVLLGVASGDTEADAGVMAGKIAGLRILPDAEGKMNLSVSEAGGSVLLVSQFTLLADVRRGRRPSFTEAAPPGEAASLVERVAVAIRDAGIPCETGRFGAHMEVELVNDGPVTIVIDVIGGRVV
jgi:D-tyrosyl-tRNA(Tyr) deacylase